jgi:maleylpyruvate isomerase
VTTFQAIVQAAKAVLSCSLGFVDGALNRLIGATERLNESIAQMTAADIARPSLLDGWTRGHVLVHLARNADGLRNLLLSARTGEPLRMYPSLGAREADIVAGIGRPGDVTLADTLEASRRFVVDAAAFPEECWPNEVEFSSGAHNAPLVSAARILELRLVEVEVHHVDLDLDYSFADTPVLLGSQLLLDFVARQDRSGTQFALELEDRAETGVGGIRSADFLVVRGSTADALAWLTGRSSEGVRCTSGGPLPRLASFG